MYNHQYKNIGKAISILVTLSLGNISALHAKPVISEQDMDKAKVLFSGLTEEDYYRTDEMLISATGSMKPVFLAPSVATVITKEEIEAMGATTLDEVLETVPGLHVQPSNSLSRMTLYSIRGILTERTPQILLLVNGIPLKDPINENIGSRFTIPVSMISRVEVVRGPGSAVFGADAFAGTINVITKDGQEINGTQVGVRYGSFNTKDIWLQHGGNAKGWDYVTSFETLLNDTDSNRTIEKDQINQSGALNYDRELYQFEMGVRKNQWNVRFWGQQIRNAGLVVGALPVLDPIGDLNVDHYILDATYQNKTLNKDWILDVHVNYNYYKGENYFVLFPPGTTLGPVTYTDGLLGNPGSKSHEILAETVGYYSGNAQHSVRIAAGFMARDLNTFETRNFGAGVLDGTETVVDASFLKDTSDLPSVFLSDKQRTILYASAQDEWTFAKSWELTAGVRYDHYSDFGNTVNPRAALVWQTRYDLVTKLLYGRAFRKPTTAEQFAKSNPVALGNDNLDPETIDTFEFAIDYRPTVNLILKSNLFVYEINGLIEVVDDAGASTKTFQNIRDQKGHGAEFEFDWRIDNKLRTRANAAWFKVTDKDSGDIVPNSARAQAYGNIHYQFIPKWSVDSQWFWIRYRARVVTDTREAIDDYHLVNLTLRRKDLFKHADLAIAVRNIFDADVREPSNPLITNDYPMNSRGVWAELKIKF